MIDIFQNNWLKKLFIAIIVSVPLGLIAQEEEIEYGPASMKLTLVVEDSIKTCKVLITDADKPVEGVQVRFFVKRFFSKLPLIANGKSVSTNETGVASVEFPDNLPGDENGIVVVTAAVEDDDNYGSFEATDSTKWGAMVSYESQEEEWGERSLSGTGDKVPLYLVMIAGVIIIIVWGTLFYVIYSLVKIKKAG